MNEAFNQRLATVATLMVISRPLTSEVIWLSHLHIVHPVRNHTDDDYGDGIIASGHAIQETQDLERNTAEQTFQQFLHQRLTSMAMQQP